MRPRTRVLSGCSNVSLLVSATAALLLSACSSDMERFADNPTQGDDSIYTASVPKSVQGGNAASDTSVSGRPLAGAAIKPRPGYASNGYNYQKSFPQPAYRQGPQQASDQHASATVRVEPGMTLYTIARSHNLAVNELAAANDIKPPYGVHVGQVLRVPGPAASVQPRQAEAQPAYAKPDQNLASGSVHNVRAGETLFSLGRTYGVSPYRIADLNHLPHNVALSVGQTIQIPNEGSAITAVAKPKGQERLGAANELEAKPQVHEPEPSIKQSEQQAAAAPPAPQGAQQQVSAAPEPQPQQEQSGLALRWPAKGRVISEYGSKPNGLRNEGINISVPEGTSIRAAEGGVVAYAGNELKGYGNLVLIRHEGGWVTAYAHNKELFVKRGDAVKRVDVIAKAGQTGSVTRPQVHFEVRKGATAVDPMRFLNSATAHS